MLTGQGEKSDVYVSGMRFQLMRGDMPKGNLLTGDKIILVLTSHDTGIAPAATGGIERKDILSHSFSPYQANVTAMELPSRDQRRISGKTLLGDMLKNCAILFDLGINLIFLEIITE
ncbi:MAG: hypothetical protein M0009_00500 [Deltaproteobacteria bacterium]|nr:hypothetical protein [Deltaproteobacteria bacterium]